MNRFILSFGVSLMVTLLSCDSESVEPNMDGEVFLEGLIHYNSDIVQSEINKLTVDLKPDSDGHQSNLNILIHRIEQQTESLSVLGSCYACIYTLPPQSEISLEVDSLGIRVSRTIDILTPEKENLSYIGLHN
jgi:hypothetical protein